LRKKWLIVTGAVVLAVVMATVAFATNPIKLIVNGQEIKPDVPPQIINGRTMVPVKWVAEALGADVEWDDKNRAVIIKKDTQNKISSNRLLQQVKGWYTGRC
jgi:Copper amine oxidase N-terminal domain.